VALTADTDLITADGGVLGSPAPSFAQMRDKVLDYLDRPELKDQFPFWVTLFQAKLNRVLRTAGGEKQAVLTPDATGAAPLPADYQAWRSVQYLSGGWNWTLDYATPDILAQEVPVPYAGNPRLFTIEGTTLFVQPSGTVTLTYYRGVPAYFDGVLNDWILIGNPDIYLYGLLAEAEKYLKNDERAATWEAQMATSLNDLIGADRDARWGRAKIKMSGWTP
jgi:hypothetical protein